VSFTRNITNTPVTVKTAAVVDVCPCVGRAQGTQDAAIPMNTIGHGIGREERDEKPATRDQGEKLE
jgi:hypothetical protein